MRARAGGMNRGVAIALVAVACRPPGPPLAPAGASGVAKTAADDGAGGLAQASAQFIRLEEGTEEPPGEAAPPDPDGTPFGGQAYAGWRPPTYNGAPNRAPRYRVSGNLRGAIEGTVTWGGAAVPKLATPCGPIANPSVRIGAGKALGGVLVYIDRVSVGRTTTPSTFARPAQVGGAIVKHGCALLPAMQIATPLPVELAVSSDASRARLRVTGATGEPRAYELQEGGLVRVLLAAGVTRIDSEDGAVTPAWVLAVDTPYFALTDDAGRFRIDELAPGTYDLRFWQAPLARDGAPIVARRSVIVTAATARANVTLK